MIAGAKWYATKWSRALRLLSKSSALSWCSLPPVGLKGKSLNWKNRRSVLRWGWVFFPTNATCQWNPVYKAFHQNYRCGNETMRRYYVKRDLDAANLRPALEYVCGKQTPSARKWFIRANLKCVLDVKMKRRLRSRSVHLLGLALREPLRSGDFQNKTSLAAGKIGNRHCAIFSVCATKNAPT